MHISEGISLSNASSKRPRLLTVGLAVLLLGAIVEGLFYAKLFPLISQRSWPIFRLTPYNLFPTDLFFVPLALLLGSIMAVPSKGKMASQRGGLLAVWWAICGFGIVVGYLNGTPNLLQDTRELFLRSLLAPAFYLITLNANARRGINMIINISTWLACILIVRDLIFLTGSDNPLVNMIGGSVWSEYAFLFPYSILLTRMLIRPSNFRTKLQLAILALSTIGTLWKPNVAAFLICTALGIFFVRPRASLEKVDAQQATLIVIIISVMVFLATFVVWSGAGSYVSSLFLRTYLKQGFVIQDLTGGRLSLAILAINGWLNHPIIGNGFGAPLSGNILNAGLGVYIYWAAVDPHNILLQFLYQTGIIGLFAVLILMFIWLRRATDAGQYVISDEMDLYRYGIVLFILTVLVTSLYGQSVISEVPGYLFWASLGMEAALATKIYERHKSDQAT